jgi:uncharacterized protein (TIGR04255 family)
VLEPNEGLRLKDAATAAGFAVQRLEQAQQQSVRLEVVAGQPPAPSIELRNIGWQLIAPEAGCVATVMPGVMTLQTTQYRSWAETFRPLLASVLTAVGEVLAPQIRQRVGLRYIDRLVDPDASSAFSWRGRVIDGILGPVADPTFGERVVTMQQQLELTISDNSSAVVRHGPFADGAAHGAISYMIDIDAFDIASAAYEVDTTLAVADELNRVALSLFQAMLNPDYLAELREGP